MNFGDITQTGFLKTIDSFCIDSRIASNMNSLVHLNHHHQIQPPYGREASVRVPVVQ